MTRPTGSFCRTCVTSDNLAAAGGKIDVRERMYRGAPQPDVEDPDGHILESLWMASATTEQPDGGAKRNCRGGIARQFRTP